MSFVRTQVEQEADLRTLSGGDLVNYVMRITRTQPVLGAPQLLVRSRSYTNLPPVIARRSSGSRRTRSNSVPGLEATAQIRPMAHPAAGSATPPTDDELPVLIPAIASEAATETAFTAPSSGFGLSSMTQFLSGLPSRLPSFAIWGTAAPAANAQASSSSSSQPTIQ